MPDRAVMGTEHPSLQQRDNAVHRRQQVFALGLRPLDVAVMPVALQPSIGVQSVCAHRAPRFDRLGEPCEAAALQELVERDAVAPQLALRDLPADLDLGTAQRPASTRWIRTRTAIRRTRRTAASGT